MNHLIARIIRLTLHPNPLSSTLPVSFMASRSIRDYFTSNKPSAPNVSKDSSPSPKKSTQESKPSKATDKSKSSKATGAAKSSKNTQPSKSAKSSEPIDKKSPLKSDKEESPENGKSPARPSNKHLANVNVTPSKTPVSDKTFGTPEKGCLSIRKRCAIESSSDSESEEAEKPQPKSKPPPMKQAKSCDAASYDPSVSKYDPINDAVWKQGEAVPYLALAKTLALIENESANLKKTEILSNYLASVMMLSPKDAKPSTLLCLNKLAPDYDGLELGVGESLILKALAEATGRKHAIIKAEIEKEGDLGIVAEQSRAKQKTMFAPPKLTISQVFDKLTEVAKMTGHASASKKTEIIKGLIVRSRDCETRFLVRSLNGKLRIRLAEKMLLNALAKASVVYENPKINRSGEVFDGKAKEAIALIREAFSEAPDLGTIVEVILEHGLRSLPEYCKIQPGVPIKPMLAHPSTGISDVLKRFDEHKFICEYKYDGERAQIHLLEDGSISIFSRNLENNTTKYPDIISHINKSYDASKVSSFILDAEVVAWDKEGSKIQPFQVLSTRKRKDVKEEDIKVTVCLFVFDLLYVNGKSLTKKSLRKRRQHLHESFNEVDGFFFYAQGCEVTTDTEIQELIDKAVTDRCEGLMVKCLDEDATYEIAKRSHNWIKLKKDYLEGVGDSLDLVCVGAWFGKGKRVNNYGSFLMACYDEESEEYQTICRLGTGFSDEDLDSLSKKLGEHSIDSPPKYYSWDPTDTEPNVWFEPSVLFEVKCADLTISPRYRAAIGKVDDARGISLRFPRYVRIRDDKESTDATSSDQVAEMYNNQDMFNDGPAKGDDDDYD